jgi:hypothetical protein
VRYVAIGALAATFWLVVATVRLIVSPPPAPERCALAPAAPPTVQPPPIKTVVLDDYEATHLSGRSPAPSGNPISKMAVVTGFNAVRPQLADCYRRFQVPGQALVNVVIAKSGRVSSAVATGQFAGTPTGACVEAAARTAHFPPSDGLSTPYPFYLR